MRLGTGNLHTTPEESIYPYFNGSTEKQSDVRRSRTGDDQLVRNVEECGGFPEQLLGMRWSDSTLLHGSSTVHSSRNWYECVCVLIRLNFILLFTDYVSNKLLLIIPLFIPPLAMTTREINTDHDTGSYTPIDLPQPIIPIHVVRNILETWRPSYRQPVDRPPCIIILFMVNRLKDLSMQMR